MSNYAKVFQWNLEYDVYKSFIKIILPKVAILNVNIMKTRLSQNDVLCRNVNRVIWPFMWYNRYMRIFCARKVNISTKKVAAKNIDNSYCSKTLNDFCYEIGAFLPLYCQQANLKMTLSYFQKALKWALKYWRGKILFW